MTRIILLIITGMALAGCQTTGAGKGSTIASGYAPPPRTLDCMARNVYREAAHEGERGWLAVFAVTMNRVRSQAFPNSVCDVVHQKVTVKRRGRYRAVYQFSWLAYSRLRPRPNTEKFEVVKRKVAAWMANGYADPTGGATHYHATYVNPRWRLTRTTRIGRHIFYRPKGGHTPVDPGRR